MSIQKRILRFAFVGTLCFVVQWSLIQAFCQLMHVFYADALAFLLSAQLNFILSHAFTWKDRQSSHTLLRWQKFNLAALTSAGINAGVFWALLELMPRDWVALIIANAISTAFTFVINHHVTFRKETCVRPAEPGVFRASL